MFAGALALVLGALMFGGEYGWGTVKTHAHPAPGRVSVLGGQLVALGVALLVGVRGDVRAQRREHLGGDRDSPRTGRWTGPASPPLPRGRAPAG